MNQAGYQILLASTSPRRVDLLKQVGLQFRTFAPNIDEKVKKNERPQMLVSRLAREKAESALGTQFQLAKANSKLLIIAADTIVVSPLGKKILGKPESENEARQMLKQLAGKTHTVLTGYCILALNKNNCHKRITRVVKTRVKMRPLNLKSIEKYISSGEPMDKAGSYAAQGLGTALIERIDGSYTNVVGLPITQVLSDLEKLTQTHLFC